MTRTAADVSTRRVAPMEPVPPYGMELVMDLHDCDHLQFCRESITAYFEGLCELIGMEREELHFWDYEPWQSGSAAKKNAPSHLKGTSAVQFIRTSNITIHTLDDLHRVYINIFSCREFKTMKAVAFTVEWFGAGWCGHHAFERS